MRPSAVSPRRVVALIVAGGVLVANLGIAPAIRLAAVVAYLAVVGAHALQKGPKLEGLVSVGVAAVVNLMLLIATFLRIDYPEPSLEVQQTVEAMGLILLVFWIAAAAIAIRSRRQPNRSLGWLSLGAGLLPGLLAYLDHCQYLICARVGIEWSRFRPLEMLLEWLWGL